MYESIASFAKHVSNYALLIAKKGDLVCNKGHNFKEI